MKTTLLNIWISLLFLAICTSCSKEEEFSHVIDITSIDDKFVISPLKNSSVTINFTTNVDWNAKTDADWAILSPTSGKSGNSSITVIAKDDNNTGEERSAKLTIYSTDTNVEIPFVQQKKDVINLTQKTYTVSHQGGEVIVEYSTNIPLNQIKISFGEETVDWIEVINEKSKALVSDKIKFLVQPNIVRKERSARFKIIAMQTPDSDEKLLESDVITIKQEMVPVGTSSDFSKDKQVIVLQKHTVGNGIPLVFLGDGFLDNDINNGHYLEVMNKAVENFFTEEPIKSLKDYFDIWAVNAVSINNAFGTQYTTKFGCRLQGGGSTLIEGNHEKVMEYAGVIPELKNNSELMSEATCVVILNTTEYAGTCYFGFNDSETNKKINLAIGYCPMINGINDDMFRRVLCHECIGHGFAKLLDEYSYQEMGRMPLSEIEQNQRIQKDLGWYMNVDFTNDRNKVLWSKFLKDSRYTNKDNHGEILSIYEGACTYWLGAYRPTNESMMRSNTHGFNAPSREAIYKRVMSVAFGKEWIYDFNEFTEFDLQHLPRPNESRSTIEKYEYTTHLEKPIFTNKPIKLHY